MKYYALVFSIGLAISLFSNCKKENPDPCLYTTCDFGEDCVHGACECLVNDWTYLNWEMVCEDCPGLSNSRYFTLLIDSLNAGVIQFQPGGINTQTLNNIRIAGSGVVYYSVIYENDYSYVIDQGNIQLFRCESQNLTTIDD